MTSLRFAFLAMIFSLSAASAQSVGEGGPNAAQQAYAKSILQLALKSIDRASCGNDQKCAPATETEFANPPLMMEEAHFVIATASRSAMATFCNLDSRRSFLPMIATMRNERKLNNRQLALAAVMHGIAEVQVLDHYKKTAQCTDDMRTRLDASLPKI